MRFINSILSTALLFVAATTLSTFPGTVFGQAGSLRLSPNALVADLYRVHDHKHSPFFQTRNRALLDKYFEKSLADLIWKDAVSSKGEVGAIEADPLYDAQDVKTRKFAIGKAIFADGKAKVNVTFTNYDQPMKFVFILVNGRSGWRISDIEYGEGRSLREIVKR